MGRASMFPEMMSAIGRSMRRWAAHDMRVLVFAAYLVPATSLADSCANAVPSELGAALGSSFSSYRVPKETDNLAEYVRWSKKDQGRGCLGVATADFDGDGARDWILGLSSKSGDGGLVVAAMSREASWEFHELAKWPEDRVSLYVDVGPRGTYVSAIEEAQRSSNESSPLTCENSVAVFGKVESTQAVYCNKSGSWQHVWTGD
ncbi:MAG: hypothetical protein KDA57_18490 [Planctomycetales bacterium]|nr:hypothetical protein [Planctomycetales bacterium]